MPCKCGEHCRHGADNRFDGRAKRVPSGEPGWIIVGQPGRTVPVLPDERLQRKVDTGALTGLHERRAPKMIKAVGGNVIAAAGAPAAPVSATAAEAGAAAAAAAAPAWAAAAGVCSMGPPMSLLTWHIIWCFCISVELNFRFCTRIEQRER